MQKKTISIVLCMTMLVSMLVMAVPTASAASADTAPVAKAYTVENPSDFSWDNANVYFLMTDRFYNGDRGNDHAYGRTLNSNGQPISGWDTAPGTFHGGDFKGITQKINEGYFTDLGVNAIWISAPYEQIHGYVDSGDDTNHIAHYSYHGYYVLDYTETDKNFGTKEEFRTLVNTAHSKGIRVVLDIVMNHAGYNNIVDMEEFNYGTITNRSAIDAYKYKLTDVAGFHQYIDYESSSSDWGRWWGSDWIRSGLPGYQNDGGGELTSSLAGLPDFRTESTNNVSVPQFLQSKWQKEGTLSTKQQLYGDCSTVSDYLTSWLAQWVKDYGVDGFRCDTAKHVELASWNKLKTKCVAALKSWRQNNPNASGADWDEDFWMTGECWGHGVGKSPYFYEGGFDSMINFEITSVLGQNSGFPDASSINGLYQRYASTINSDENFNMLTYLSSHDTNIVRTGDNYYQGTALLLCPGAVQPFYGDETARPLVSGVPVEGGGHALRSDMNWGQNTDLLNHWKKVGKFRANHVAVGAGDHQLISNANGLTFSRSYDDGETADGVICTMGASKNTNMTIDVSSMWGNGKTLTNEYDGTTAVVADGKVTFNTGAQGVILISGPQSTINMSVKGPKYAFYDSQTVTVKLRGADYAMASVNGGTPFRVVNGQTFSIGDGIEVGTVFNVTLSATNEVETLEKSFAFKKKDPDAVVRLYFDNTSYNWSNIHAYVYDESVSTNVVKNADWPGEAMEYDDDTGLYVYEVPDELTENGLVIFNTGSGGVQYPGVQEKGLAINETDKLFAAGNSWTDYNGQTVQPTDPPEPGTQRTIYFDNTQSNYQTPYAYVWSNTDGNPVAWPGYAMTKASEMGENIYKITCDSKYDNVIFSNSGSPQTGNIENIPYLNGKYANGTWTEVTGEPVTDIGEGGDDGPIPTNPSPNPGKVVLGDADQDGRINVKDITAIQRHLAEVEALTGNGLTAADTNQDAKVTIKDATCLQYYLVEMVVSGNHTGEQVDEGYKPAATRTIYFDNSKLNYTNPRIHVWVKKNGTDVPYKDWPGDTMKAEGNNIYSYVCPAEYNCCLFNDGNNSEIKTPDLRDIPYTEALYSDGVWTQVGEIITTEPQPITDPDPSNTIYLDASNNNAGDEEFYIWTWNDTTDGIWVKGTGSASKVTFTGVKNNVVFTRMNPACNGNPSWDYVWNQSSDHVTQLGKTFVTNSWFDGDWTNTPDLNPVTNPDTETRTIILDNSATNYAKPYCYVWKTVGNTDIPLNSWPGTEMTSLGNNLYSVTVPAEYNNCVFSNNGYPQTDDLDNIPYTSAKWTGSAWVESDAPEITTEPVTNPDGDVITLDASALAVGNEKWYIWTWNDTTDGVWIGGNGSASAVTFTGDFKSNILFARVNATAATPDWSAQNNVWNQTGNLTTQIGGTYKLTDWANNYMLGNWQ